MKPVQVFEDAIVRSEYLVDLYDLLLNQRERAIRKDWADSFKRLMRWQRADELVRVDGNGCILVLRNKPDWEMKDFTHPHLAELLRAALTCAVSASDRYFHDLISSHVLTLLAKPYDQIPNSLARFEMTLIDAEISLKKALETEKGKRKATRPRTILKERFCDALHRETFQTFQQIGRAFGMLGLKDTWRKVAKTMNCTVEDIKAGLTKIVRRRNQIVHEGDMMREARPRAVKLNDIRSGDVKRYIKWLASLVKAVSEVVDENL